MKFVFDEHLPPRLAKAIGVLAENEPYEIDHLRSLYPAGTKDLQWIPELGRQEGCVFISEDRRIRTRPAEKEALRASGLVGFFLAKGWNQEGLWERAALLIRWWPRIVATASSARPGDQFEVPHRSTPSDLKAPRR
ncbi:hypothetical protein [Magnetospirillum sp. UT-4]|uniref:PIN-like domain-containing protein n=1 Tax=Magnetospirillum sp. UT-4 TaxID=2681467 RepID=UPI001385B2DF|nr:hypothetical protein [Magnetospirillum sp. UT-4]CAA7613480.1 conserved hypothetical protein [Magnetospirillum sp. UT-4]